MTMTVSLSKPKNQRKEVGRYAASSFSYPPLSLRSSGIDFMLIFRLENAKTQRSKEKDYPQIAQMNADLGN